MFLAKKTLPEGGTHDCRNKDSTGEDDITTARGTLKECLGGMPETERLPQPVLRV